MVLEGSRNAATSKRNPVYHMLYKKGQILSWCSSPVDLVLGILVSRTEKECITDVLNHPVYGNLIHNEN